MNTAAALSRPKPLVPDDITPSARALPRAAYAALVAATRNANPVDTCRKIYPHDQVAPRFLERTATTGATTGVSGWASQLTSRALSAWFASLAPESAAAELIRRGISVSVTEFGSISIPMRSAAPTAAPFVAESDPIPARSYTLGAALLQPKKIALLVAMTCELAMFSDAAAVLEQLLREDGAAGLDAAWFGTQAASASAHAGLLNGLVAGTGSAVMSNDLSKLAETVMANGSGEAPLFIASPGRAAAARIRQPAEATATILPSSALPADRVVCVDVGAIVSATSGSLELEAASDALIHMESAPLNISSGAPGAGFLATPTQSMFQTAQVVVRLVADVAFGIRRSGAVAYMDGCTW